jgi:O-antigen ligase
VTLTGLAFMCAFLAALGLALFRHPIYGLYAYVADFYLHPPSRWWGQFLPDLRWSMLAAVVTLIAILLRASPDAPRQRWYQTTPAKLMILFTVWFWVGGLWALDPTQHWPAAVLEAKYLLVFYMVYRLIDTPAKVTSFLLAHVAGCFYLGILAFGSDPSSRLDGVGGPGINDSNTLSMHLDTGVIAAAMLVLHLKDWRRYFCILAIAFAMNAIVLTGSRGAFLALVAGGVMLYYLRPVAYKKMFYMFAVLGILLFLRMASTQFWNRMDTVQVAASGNEAAMDNSALSRYAMANAQLQMAKSYPLGAGHRGSEVLSPKYLAAQFMTNAGVRSSHNVFLTILVEQGIPGVIIFVVFIVWTGKALRKLKRETATPNPTPEQVTRAVHAAALGGSLVVVLIAGIFADFSKCEVQVWMMALLAALLQPAVARVAATAAAPVAAGALPAGAGYPLTPRGKAR